MRIPIQKYKFFRGRPQVPLGLICTPKSKDRVEPTILDSQSPQIRAQEPYSGTGSQRATLYNGIDLPQHGYKRLARNARNVENSTGGKGLPQNYPGGNSDHHAPRENSENEDSLVGNQLTGKGGGAGRENRTLSWMRDGTALLAAGHERFTSSHPGTSVPFGREEGLPMSPHQAIITEERANLSGAMDAATVLMSQD